MSVSAVRSFAVRQDTRTDNLLAMNDTVKIMFIVQIAMYHYDMYVKVAYDNFDNKRRYDDDDDEEVLSHHVF